MKSNDVKIRKQNMKIYSLYRMLSLDHIFYYAIEFMFLTQVKNLTASDIVLGQSFYSLFSIILQIPIVIAIDKIGKKRCTVIANIFLALYVLVIMNCKNIWTLIFAQLLDAFCFSIKDTADISLLNNSIPDTSKKGEIYSKIEGRGSKNYYYISAITAVLAGILYQVNPYIPLISSFIISIISIIMSLAFTEIAEENKTENESIITYINELKISLKFIFKSNRLKALLLYSGIIWAVFCLMTTCVNNLLKDIGAVAIILAIKTSMSEIFSGIGSKKQLDFHNKFKNKSLSVILVGTLASIFIIGITGVLKLNMVLSISIIFPAVAFYNLFKGINQVITARYLQNFASENLISKIYAVNSISRNLARAILGFIGSYLLEITDSSNAIIIIGIIFFIIVIMLIMYMKTRIGLKPEDYKLEDIKFE